MKRTIAGVWALFLALPSQALHVMHIGNSLTDHAYGMHEIAESKGYADVLMGRHMIPGAPMYILWENPDVGFWDPDWDATDGNLANYRWDALVLQVYRNEWFDDITPSVSTIREVRSTSPSCKVYVYAHCHTETPDNFPAQWGANLDYSTSQRAFELMADSISHRAGVPVYIVPNGNVCYRIWQDIGQGKVPGVTQWSDLYRDSEHFNNLGAYITACTHFATIYGASPSGGAITRQNEDEPYPSPAFAEYVWGVVWQVVSAYERSGVTGAVAARQIPGSWKVANHGVQRPHAVTLTGRRLGSVVLDGDAAGAVYVVEPCGRSGQIMVRRAADRTIP